MVVTVIGWTSPPGPLSAMRRGGTRMRAAECRFDRLRDLRHLERLPLHLAQPLRGHEMRSLEQLHELAVVHLGDESSFEPRQQLAQVARERVQVAEVDVRDV